MMFEKFIARFDLCKMETELLGVTVALAFIARGAYITHVGIKRCLGWVDNIKRQICQAMPHFREKMSTIATRVLKTVINIVCHLVDIPAEFKREIRGFHRILFGVRVNHIPGFNYGAIFPFTLVPFLLLAHGADINSRFVFTREYEFSVFDKPFLGGGESTFPARLFNSTKFNHSKNFIRITPFRACQGGCHATW